MSYLVLARKYRPQDFDDLAGQEHITSLLKKAIENDRVAHAYLFCGPRGVGKTSCARILAKCLNDEKGPTTKPDHSSSIAQEITKGTSFDVLEIDGASNRGIDEIRALRENVKFASTFGRFKIYIVDEVHMLTSEAFNALLKTLEEPPEHVKFIFATTEPNKVPPTILSRCQRYDFKRIQIKVIIECLQEICKQEGLSIDEQALYAIGKAAQGSLRDALSILDQLSALKGEEIKSDDVYSMLGIVETELLFEIVDKIALKDCAAALKTLDAIIDRGKDAKQLLKDIIDHFRNLMIIKVGGKSLGKLVDYPIAIKENLLTQCDQFDIQDILDAIDVFIKAQGIARVTEQVRMPLEVAIANLTMGGSRPKLQSTASPQPSAKRSFSSPGEVLKSKKGFVNAKSDDNPVEEEKESSVSEKDSGQTYDEESHEIHIPQMSEVDMANLTIETFQSLWETITHAISKRKMSLATYLQEGYPVDLSGTTLTVGFKPTMNFHRDAADTPENRKIFEDVLEEKFQQKFILKLVCMDNVNEPVEDPDVKNALNAFAGQVINRWHEDSED